MDNKWIAILGSPRCGKNTDKIMGYYIEELEKRNRKVKKVVLSDLELNICNGCESCIRNYECRHNDAIATIINEIKDVEGIILGSPSYNYNVTSYMKIFLDRLFCLFSSSRGSWSSELDSKGVKAIIIGVCAGPNEVNMGFTVEAMKRVMLDHGIDVIIEESYYGAKRTPVETNQDIRIDISNKIVNLVI
ncbi:flavodoxin family protein [Tissierella sp. Yu-01]|uniref:flavodoxin family protein n=1 Tax=Tissierella sp. Yu-01 TaxID=3035694 RepID=UPI00240DC942|nr:flavodoxin family protein [Tissierella sp. Yu-01]WFA08773.1 flavodoxin family protein [Tissierella sp. Yu-01]